MNKDTLFQSTDHQTRFLAIMTRQWLAITCEYSYLALYSRNWQGFHSEKEGTLMFPKKLPEGYTIAFIEGKWYPLHAVRFYSAGDPDGSLAIGTMTDSKMSEDGTFPELAFSKQQDALAACWQDARLEVSLEQERWQRLACESHVYPERCAHYVALIEQIRRKAPLIKRWSYPSYEVEVVVPSHHCPQCLITRSPFCTTAATIEEALAEAAECVYALRCLCERMQDERLTLVA
jgi:hypothetical protein